LVFVYVEGARVRERLPESVEADVATTGEWLVLTEE